jgi:transcriptional regulator with XRE-family HTH domain
VSESKSFQEKCRRLGAKVKYYRTIAGMNQTVLATKLGISYQYLSRIECGKQSPSFPLLVSLAEALKIDLADLVSDKDIGRF